MYRNEAPGSSTSWVGGEDSGPLGRQIVIKPCPYEKNPVFSLPRIIQTRELYGKAKQFSRMEYRTCLSRLKLAFPIQIAQNHRIEDLCRQCVFIGLSNDSRYVVALSWTTGDESGSDSASQVYIIIFKLSPTTLVPAFIASFESCPTESEIYVTFPLSSSHASIITVIKNIEDVLPWSFQMILEPRSVLAIIKFILFRYRIQVSMTTCLVVSHRWRSFKMFRTVLRSMDHGGILNCGTALNAYTFTKTCPPAGAANISRMVYQIVDGGSECPADAVSTANAFNSHDITVKDATPNCPVNLLRVFRLKPVSVKEPNVTPGGLSEPVFFSESVLEIERLIFEVLPEVMPLVYSSYIFKGLVDYEVDVCHCDGFIAHILLSVVIEAKGPGESGKHSPFIILLYVVWDTFKGTRQVYPFEGMRQIGWKVARRPDSWYPFRASMKVDAPDERMLSNLPYLAGRSMEILASPSPGITIWRELPPLLRS